MEQKEKITEEEKEVEKADRINLFRLADGRNVTVFTLGDPDHHISGRVTVPKGSKEIMLFAGNKTFVIPQSSIMKMSWLTKDEEEEVAE